MEKIVPYIVFLSLLIFLIVAKTFSPFWILLIVIFFLWSYRRNSDVRPVFFISVFLLFIYLLLHHFAVLVPFVIGAGIAYVISPIIEILERKKIPRIIAILCILLPLVAVVPVLVFLLALNLINELRFLIEKIPGFIASSKVFIGRMLESLNAAGISLSQEVIVNTISGYLGSITGSLFQTIMQIGQGVKGILFLFYNFVLIPIVAYLFLFDRKKIGLWISNLVPDNERDSFDGFVKRIDKSFARYLRGQFILMILVGFLIGFALWLLGIRYYVLLGIVAAFCNLIPNVGFVLSLLIAVIIGLLIPPPLISIVKILFVFLCEQMLENWLLGPLIIGKASGMSPVVVMLALVLGGTVAGFWGLIFAIPLVIFLREFLNHFWGFNL